MANRPFTKGIHDLGNGAYAYVQPDGSWGFSNAGLIVSDRETLLVDTLMSIPLTREMLDDFARSVPSGEKIDRLVNTHANPDHFFGNQLLSNAEIISTSVTAEDIAKFDPTLLSALPETWQKLGEAGEFLYETMGRRFDFAGIDEVTVPTTRFDDRMTLSVGSKRVDLIDVGPAHTASDTIVHVAEDRVVFTGDILFNEGHPIMWEGPIENWIRACEYIESLDVETVVPGHGPVTDVGAVKNLRMYFEYILQQARDRFDAGMGWEEAARDINIQEYRGWSDPERIVANVYSMYRQFGAGLAADQEPFLFAAMLRWQKWNKDMLTGDCEHRQ